MVEAEDIHLMAEPYDVLMTSEIDDGINSGTEVHNINSEPLIIDIITGEV
jgi:hypothetical protein